jgi:hypothetical protein
MYRIFEKLVGHVKRLRCHENFIDSVQLDSLQVVTSSRLLRHDEPGSLMRHEIGDRFPEGRRNGEMTRRIVCGCSGCTRRVKNRSSR